MNMYTKFNIFLSNVRYRALSTNINFNIHLTKSPKRDHIYKMCLYMLQENKCLILTPSIRTPPGRGGHGNQLLYGPPRAGGVTLGFRFGISSDKLLKFAA